MPLYEYLCPGCGRRFEALARSWSDASSCPGCGNAEVERQLSTFAMAGGGMKSTPAMARPVGGGCCGGGCGCAH